MPDSSSKHTFNTLARESAFRSPPSNSYISPILNEFVAPHIESFNALFDDSGLPSGDGDGRGLLSLAIKDIGERVVFDGAEQAAAGSIQKAWGNKLDSKTSRSLHAFCTEKFQVWIEQVSIARPMVPDRDKRATERKIFPAEVGIFLTSRP
jgi:DNA-directed RNA polymerase I subunit RPA2